MKIEELNSYRLVGGTGLSLLLGHRKSLDTDLFTAEYIRGETLIPLIDFLIKNTENLKKILNPN